MSLTAFQVQILLSPTGKLNNNPDSYIWTIKSLPFSVRIKDERELRKQQAR